MCPITADEHRRNSRLGAEATNARLSPDERTASARRAVLARWARRTPEERADYARRIAHIRHGTVAIGAVETTCACGGALTNWQGHSVCDRCSPDWLRRLAQGG
jgi:hypothetical protein